MSNEIKPIGALESLGYIWGAAGFVGFGAMALLFFMGDWSALQAIFTGGAMGFTVGVVLTVLFGVQSVPSAAGHGASDAPRKMNAVERAAASRPDTAKVLEPVPSPHKTSIDPSPVSDSMGINAGAAGDAAAAGDKLASASEASISGIATAGGSGATGAGGSGATGAGGSGATGAAKTRAAATAGATPAAAAAAAASAAGAASVAEDAPKAAQAKPAKVDTDLSAAAASGTKAERAAASAATPADNAGDAGGDAAAASAKTAAKADAGAGDDEAEGTKPELLSAPRAGGADDLKKIKGVGPKLEGELNSKGVYHYDQIASWSDDEIAWADQHLVKFKGRVSRDKWRDQAKLLAAGEETEFSKKVDKGGVY